MGTKVKQRQSQSTERFAPLVVLKTQNESEPEIWEILGRPTRWPQLRANLLLAVMTVACLLPFSGRAFHVDDTLFVWTAQQIQRHVADPYGFSLVWDAARAPMASVTQNPPLSSYYAALVASLFGWSERALHCGFMLVALALISGVYRLARHFTRLPLLAALAVLLTPGVLVSASSVMCDTMMLALWVWAAIFWIEGLEGQRRWPLAVAGVLATTSALTKYFGVALLPLLLMYAMQRRKRVSSYLPYFAIPLVALVAYQLWTAHVYGRGLLLSAGEFAASQRAGTQGSWNAMSIVGLSFAGGCSLIGWTFGVLLWRRAQVLLVVAISVVAATAEVLGWINEGLQLRGGVVARFHLLTASQVALCVAGGISILALTLRDVWRNRDAASSFLFAWISGTFIFAAFVNYTVNARSVLPMIPAVGILLARRFDELRTEKGNGLDTYVALILFGSAVFSLWITAGDSFLANSARNAAMVISERTQDERGTLWFEGHWGFQYYMESRGARPLDFGDPQLRPGDLVVIPDNNIQTQGIPQQYIATSRKIDFADGLGVTTISSDLGAGFYSSYWGPLPYAIGPVPPERYWIVRLGGDAEKLVK